jgi:uncharacterized protein YjbI with pentapeptide repeats
MVQRPQDPTGTTRAALPEDLRGVDLTDADLRGVDLRGRDLTGATLANADLRHAELSGADLTDADLSSARCDNAGFGGARLLRADLSSAQLDQASFSKADLRYASLQAVSARDTRFVHADLRHADLARAVLTDADLQHARLDHAVFRDADVTRTRFRGTRGYTTVHWTGVNALDADLHGAHLFRRHVMDALYLEEFRDHSLTNRVVYAVWWLTSDCGRSLGRWAAFTVLLAFAFTAIYAILPIDFGPNVTFLSPLYFSIVTLTTLGFGDVLPTTVLGQVAVMVEVIVGYVMLGGLISILSNKMARRA